MDVSDCYWGVVLLEEDEKGNNIFVVIRVVFLKKNKNIIILSIKKFLK